MELIVFDLDGTLLNGKSQISDYTRETLLLLGERDIAYTVATGRTLHSAQEVIHGHGFSLPHVYSNGAIIWNPAIESLSIESCLTHAEANHVIQAVVAHQVTPFVSSIDGDKHFVFHLPVQNDVERRLLGDFHSRKYTEVLPMAALPVNAKITNISMLGIETSLDKIYEDIQGEAHLVAYSGPAIEGNGLKWMDIHHSSASKGGALEMFKRDFGFKKIVCFGDSDNDLSMFSMADESYAPANAKPEIKAHATATIGHHDADGIAHFLRERFSL